MTRLAILADIHGNLPALEAVIADLASFDVDLVVVAGDIINFGPFSAQVLERALSLRWALMRGNHELYLLDYESPRMPAYWREFASPPYLRSVLSAQQQAILAALPDTLQLRFPDAPPVRVVHGAPGDHWRGIYPQTPDDEVVETLRGTTESTVICGHTHLPLDRQVAGWRILNPGSVGIPLDGVHGARYLLLDGDANGWQPTPRHVPFGLDAVIAECSKSHFQTMMGIDSQLIIEEFRCARSRIYPFNVWKRERYGDAPKTQAMIEEFLTLDDHAIDPYLPPPYRWFS
jgi:predicted phosphodiesterase